MAEKNRSTITFGTEDLRAAVSNYNSLSLPEIQAAYSAMLEVPEFGLKVAQALQVAAKTAANGKGSPDRVLDAAVVPAFLVGLLVGAGRPSAPVNSSIGSITERCRLRIRPGQPWICTLPKGHEGECISTTGSTYAHRDDLF
jgi:hypothetical protein